jgi:hypothetical protein
MEEKSVHKKKQKYSEDKHWDLEYLRSTNESRMFYLE